MLVFVIGMISIDVIQEWRLALILRPHRRKRRRSRSRPAGCETDAYDPMEKAILAYCEKNGISHDELFGGELITEYPFTNELKMMGHIWRKDGKIIIAAKGSPERILTICAMSDAEKTEFEKKINEL